MTLVEILVVLVVLGILSAVAVPQFLRSMAESQLDADCNRLFADLQWARTQATSQSVAMNRSGTRIFMAFDTATGSWIMQKDDGDSTFEAAADPVLRRDRLSGTSRFGFASGFSPPPIAAPLGTGNAPTSGFGASNGSPDDCLDGQVFPAPVGQPNTWAYSGAGTIAGRITFCGGPAGKMSNGALYITTSRSTSRAYAIVFNSLTSGSASLSLRRYLWDGTAWSKI